MAPDPGINILFLDHDRHLRSWMFIRSGHAGRVRIAKTGNTRRLAEAVAEAVGTEALPLNAPVDEPVDILFLGNSYYAFSIDPKVQRESVKASSIRRIPS